MAAKALRRVLGAAQSCYRRGANLGARPRPRIASAVHSGMPSWYRGPSARGMASSAQHGDPDDYGVDMTSWGFKRRDSVLEILEVDRQTSQAMSFRWELLCICVCIHNRLS